VRPYASAITTTPSGGGCRACRRRRPTVRRRRDDELIVSGGENAARLIRHAAWLGFGCLDSRLASASVDRPVPWG
jgi:hypothetical protein